MSEELRLQLRRRQREVELRRERQEEFRRDVVSVASRPEGARLFRRLLEDADIFQPGYRPEPEGAFLAGRRDAGLRLWRLLRDNLPPRRFAAIALAPGRLTEAPDDPEDSADDEDPHLGDFF